MFLLQSTPLFAHCTYGPRTSSLCKVHVHVRAQMIWHKRSQLHAMGLPINALTCMRQSDISISKSDKDRVTDFFLSCMKIMRMNHNRCYGIQIWFQLYKKKKKKKGKKTTTKRLWRKQQILNLFSSWKLPWRQLCSSDCNHMNTNSVIDWKKRTKVFSISLVKCAALNAHIKMKVKSTFFSNQT